MLEGIWQFIISFAAERHAPKSMNIRFVIGVDATSEVRLLMERSMAYEMAEAVFNALEGEPTND